MSVPAMVLQTIGVFLKSWVVGITAKNAQLITIILVALTLIFLVAANGFLFENQHMRAIPKLALSRRWLW